MSNSEEVQVESQPVDEVEQQTYDKIVVDFTNPQNNTIIPNTISEKKSRGKAKVVKEEKPVEEQEVKKKAPTRKKKEATPEPVVEPQPAIEPEAKKKPSPRKKKEPAPQVVEEKAEPAPVIKQASYEPPQAPDFSQYVEIIKQQQAANVQRKQMKYRSLISQAVN